MDNRILQGASAIACALSAAITTPEVHAVLVYGVTEQNILVSWDSATPGTIRNGVAINNLNIQGMDVRPADGALYAVDSLSNLLTINVTTGAVTSVNGGANNPFSPPLNGSNFGLDFNPTVDRIRVVSNADQNFRLNPITGALAGTDSTLAYASGDTNFGVNPNVTAAAYTNNFAGATTTTLYGIDAGLDVLVIQGGVGGTPSPNLGQLTTVGSLGIDVAEDGGFDIVTPAGGGDIAYAALRPAGASVSNFYSINLGTGAATLIGEIGGGVNIRAMSVVIPAPGALATLLVGAIFRRRRRRN